MTGASSGIGRDIAIYLSKLGYDLILVARDETRLQAVKKILGTNCDVIVCDLSKPKNGYQLYEKVKNKDIDIIINSAGFGLFGLTAETNLERELTMIDLNIKAAHILTKLFLPNLIAKQKGYIMNVASAAGFMAGPRLNTYYATKNYLLKFTMALYQELKESNSGVHVCALCPGPVETDFNRVAGGDFIIGGVKSSFVAKYAVDQMFKKKLIIIPTLKIKIAIFLNRLLPYKWSLKIVSRIQAKKKSGE